MENGSLRQSLKNIHDNDHLTMSRSLFWRKQIWKQVNHFYSDSFEETVKFFITLH